ncbi:MAG: hypothetical protein ABI852_11380 [Gemmatimonadaceae bacterium]
MQTIAVLRAEILVKAGRQDRAGVEFEIEIADAFVATSVRTKESRTPLAERPQND